MKKIIVTLIFALMAISMFAQSPDAFNYQAVVRDANGDILKSQDIGVKISILNSAATAVYVETHADSTNAYGVTTLNIGEGTVVEGTLSSIDWGADNYSIGIEMDLAGGESYTSFGTAPLLSVPYALSAKSVESIPQATADQIAAQETKIAALELEVQQFNSRESELLRAVANSSTSGYVTDIEGNVYPTVTIGTQVWMAKNLRVTKYNDGSQIPGGNAATFVSQNEAQSGSYIFYMDDSVTFGSKFGANYNYYAVATGNLCPTGWHVPTIDEWFTVEVEIGMDPKWATVDSVNIYTEGSTHGKAMKTTYGWNEGGNGTNTSGMSILGFGSINASGSAGGITSEGLAKGANFWSSSVKDADNTYKLFFNFGHDDNKSGTAPNNTGYHVRCVKD